MAYEDVPVDELAALAKKAANIASVLRRAARIATAMRTPLNCEIGTIRSFVNDANTRAKKLNAELDDKEEELARAAADHADAVERAKAAKKS